MKKPKMDWKSVYSALDKQLWVLIGTGQHDLFKAVYWEMMRIKDEELTHDH